VIGEASPVLLEWNKRSHPPTTTTTANRIHPEHSSVCCCCCCCSHERAAAAPGQGEQRRHGGDDVAFDDCEFCCLPGMDDVLETRIYLDAVPSTGMIPVG
jgi:hypothetical protein